MSFADDFDHYIPDDEWMSGGYSGGFSKRGRKSSSSRSYNFVDYSKRVPLYFEEVVTETDKAYLFLFKEGKTWLPKSRILELNMKKSTVYIPLWLSWRVRYFKDDP